MDGTEISQNARRANDDSKLQCVVNRHGGYAHNLGNSVQQPKRN